MRRLLTLLLLVPPCFTACERSAAPAASEEDGPFKPDSPQALRDALQADVQRLVETRDPAIAVEALSRYALTEPELVELFGPELAAQAWPGYRDQVLGGLKAEAGAVLLREAVENGRTEVWVEAIGPAWPGRTTRGDQRYLDAMKVKRPLYTIRLQKPGETLGVRLNGFVYLNGQWKALLKAYDHLPALGDEDGAGAAPEPDSAAPDSAAPDSAAPDSAAPDSAAPDSAAPDSAAPDSAAPDSAAP
ncbi:MAG: hypothetical protein R3F60_00015 [bacterium]